MWDKAHLRIPFKEQFVFEGTPIKGKRSAMVDFARYDFKCIHPFVMIDGERVYDDPQCQSWDSIPSSISTVAAGFFPAGDGFYTWPNVQLKASPSKILQGHNVFGTEDIRPGIKQMISNFTQAFPLLADHLDWEKAEIRYLDSTYSAFIESDYQRGQLLRVFETLSPNKDAITKNNQYLKLNKDSEYRTQKIYYKHQEVVAEYEAAKRKNEQDRAAILGDPKLLEFAFGRMRFEATTGHRALENEGIPTQVTEFLKFQDWYQKTYNESLCKLLWERAFNKLFAQIEGHTMKNVDDDKIKLKIDAKFVKVKDNGKICRRKANAIWNTYRSIKLEGYDQLCRENNKTFFRNVKHLEEIGLSRAFLKSLDPNKPNENVIPMVQLIKIDFTKQRPDWYVEPAAGYDDERRHLKLVS